MKSFKLFLLLTFMIVGNLLASNAPSESALQKAVFDKGVSLGYWDANHDVVGFTNENYESGTITVSTPTGNIVKTWADSNFCTLCLCCGDDIIIDARTYSAVVPEDFRERM